MTGNFVGLVTEETMAGKIAFIFGAGNIGRGFLGQLYSESGYDLLFADVDEALIGAINARQLYTIRLEDNDGAQSIDISPARVLHSQRDRQQIVDGIRQAEIGATAVGVRALPQIAPLLAEGIGLRAADSVPGPLNLIICENLNGAAEQVRLIVAGHLAPEHQVYMRSHVGFVDTVIGRMVPPLTAELRAQDPSQIIVEPFKELPVDRSAFAGDMPPIVGMELCDNFGAYTARKLYIHNAAHAVLGYLGYLRGYAYGYEALADTEVRAAVRAAMAEARDGIATTYGVQVEWLERHIDDLLHRFGNRALADTNFRLARDPMRKLGPADRLVGAARLVEKVGLRATALSLGIAAGYCFDHPQDPLAVELQQRIAQDGIEAVLAQVSGIGANEPLGQRVLEQYDLVRKQRD